jgi:hypothetical protein
MKVVRAGPDFKHKSRFCDWVTPTRSCWVLTCDTIYLRRCVLTFQRSLLPPASKRRHLDTHHRENFKHYLIHSVEDKAMLISINLMLVCRSLVKQVFCCKTNKNKLSVVCMEVFAYSVWCHGPGKMLIFSFLLFAEGSVPHRFPSASDSVYLNFLFNNI